MLPQMKNLNYEERFNLLKMPTLKFRRMRGDMIEAFKILTRLYDGRVTEGMFDMVVRPYSAVKSYFIGWFSQCLSNLFSNYETFDKYVTDLKILASTCNYGVLHNSLIRDRLICGINDSNLRKRLLRVADLDLQKCLEICRAAELSKERM
jgi:hypothetical protein